MKHHGMLLEIPSPDLNMGAMGGQEDGADLPAIDLKIVLDVEKLNYQNADGKDVV